MSEKDKGEELEIVVKKAGFIVRHEENHFFLLQKASTITPNPKIEIKRIIKCDEPFCRLVIRSGGLRALKVLQKRIDNKAIHVLSAYVGDQPVAIASLQDMGRLARVDDVMTDVPQRQKGYGRALIHHLV